MYSKKKQLVLLYLVIKLAVRIKAGLVHNVVVGPGADLKVMSLVLGQKVATHIFVSIIVSQKYFTKCDIFDFLYNFSH